MPRYIAAFDLPESVNTGDVAAFLDYNLYRVYGAVADGTVWTAEEFAADLADLAEHET